MGREVGQVLLDHAQAVLVVLHLEIGDPGDFRVDLRAAQVLRRDVLPHHRLHQRRATERHVAGALHHGDEVGQRRDVGGAGGARAHHGGHLGHHAGEDRLLTEELAGAGEPAGADRLLDAGARRVDEPDHRDALGVGDLPSPVALGLGVSPHRAGHDREVVGDERSEPPVDLAEAGDHAVGRCLPAGQIGRDAGVGGVDTDLGEGVLVEEPADALPDRQLAGRVLPGHRLVPAHLRGVSTPPGEVVGVLLHAHRQRVWPVRISSHVLMPVSGGEPLRIVSMVAISLRWWVAWLVT